MTTNKDMAEFTVHKERSGQTSRIIIMRGSERFAYMYQSHKTRDRVNKNVALLLDKLNQAVERRP